MGGWPRGPAGRERSDTGTEGYGEWEWVHRRGVEPEERRLGGGKGTATGLRGAARPFDCATSVGGGSVLGGAGRRAAGPVAVDDGRTDAGDACGTNPAFAPMLVARMGHH